LILTEEAAAVAAPVNSNSRPSRFAKVEATESKKLDRKASKRKGSGKVVADKKEVKAVIETEPVKEPVKREKLLF
jgi:hypothetical protein